MIHSIAELMSRLTPDAWRNESGFSDEIEKAQSTLFDRKTNENGMIDVLNSWLGSKHQPCLFGRIAAKNNNLSYCILTPCDLSQTDEHIMNKIKEKRLE